MRNPTTMTFQQILVLHLQNSVVGPSIIPPIAPLVNDPTTWRSAQFQSPMDKKLEELTDAVSKMTAHIANLDRRNERRPPVQQFSVQSPATGSNTQTSSCRRCGQTGHWINQCPQPDPRTCFKCGEQGHIATYCRSETNRQVRPSQQMQQNQGTRPQAQLVQNNVIDFDVSEIFPDESADYYPVETK